MQFGDKQHVVWLNKNRTKRDNEKFTIELADYELYLLEDGLESLIKAIPDSEDVARTLISKLYKAWQ